MAKQNIQNELEKQKKEIEKLKRKIRRQNWLSVYLLWKNDW